MNTLIMYDAIPATAIPVNAAVCAGYCDADYPTSWIDMVHRFPTLAAQQRVISIGTRTSTIARLIDVEPGNPATPAEAAAWIVDMHNHGVFRPGAYASMDLMAQIEQCMANTPLKRSDFVLDLADWTYSETAAQARLDQGYDCCQFSDQGGGGAYDINLINADTFIPSLTPPPPPPKTTDDAKFEGTFNTKTGAWTVAGAPAGGTVQWNANSKGWDRATVGLHQPTRSWSITPAPFQPDKPPPNP